MKQREWVEVYNGTLENWLKSRTIFSSRFPNNSYSESGNPEFSLKKEFTATRRIKALRKVIPQELNILETSDERETN